MTRRIHPLARWSALLAAFALGGCNFGNGLGINGGESPTNNSSSGTTQSTGGGKPIYTIGGSVSGLSQSGLSVGISGNSVAVASGATSYSLPNMVAAGMSYAIQVTSQPSGQTCFVNNANGMVGQANVTNANVVCSTNTFSIGGIITGLNASSVVLMNNSDSITVPVGSSAFVFDTKLPAGTVYTVSVQTQPTGETCQVINGSGTMSTAAITNLIVTCGQWVWTGGSDVVGAAGSYGTKGMAGSGNPGARQGAVSWSSSGKLWLFGGSAGGAYLNDLWKYDPSAHTWTWVSGSSSPNALGTYGSLGAPGSSYTPGARALAGAAPDSAGHLWLFGGEGVDGSGSTGSLNDLWEYDIGNNTWTWVSGANTVWPSGSTPPSTAPGGRSGAALWVDGSADVWLFGGMGTLGLTNDLWEFSSAMGWTPLNGSQTPNAFGAYGQQGKAALTNMPGSRMQAAASIDGAGNLWLFGGRGLGALGAAGTLNDLWQFNLGSMQWVWMGGWNTTGASGNYGTGSTTAVEVPGARYAAATTTDAAGNLWLFGGNGTDAAGKSGVLNDAWEYQLGTGKWVWMGGSQSHGQAGSYGSLGVGDPGNIPGARSGGIAWIDATGNFWLFGGQGLDSDNASGTLNDLWEYQP